MIDTFYLNMQNILMQLRQGAVIIYPTESVFGLGCDPDNELAISTLLKIKNRSWKKGLIIIAANYRQLIKYIDDSFLHEQQYSRIFLHHSVPITWLVPAHINTPYWLTGTSSFLAVRIIRFEPIRRLCLAFGKPLVSTSANLSGFPPARTISEVCNQLGKYKLCMMQNSILGGFPYPSKIRDIISGKLIRK